MKQILKVLNYCFDTILRIIFIPLGWIFGWIIDGGVRPRRLHQVAGCLAFLWVCYLFIDYGHDWLNQMDCRFGFSGCNRYAPPTAGEIMWRKMWLTPLLVSAAISSIWRFINHVKAELKFRRNPIEQYLELPPKKGLSGWCYRWLWWL